MLAATGSEQWPTETLGVQEHDIDISIPISCFLQLLTKKAVDGKAIGSPGQSHHAQKLIGAGIPA